MALEFPKSFPSWVYGPDGQAKLLDGPNAFAALDPAQWADSPADWFAAPMQEPAPFVQTPLSPDEIAAILDGESIVGESVNVPFVQTETGEQPEAVLTVTPPTPEPVVYRADPPVKRGPGRPRKVPA